MTIFASGPEREIQQCDWFLSGLELALPTVNSGILERKITKCHLWYKMANTFRTTL